MGPGAERGRFCRCLMARCVCGAPEWEEQLGWAALATSDDPVLAVAGMMAPAGGDRSHPGALWEQL